MWRISAGILATVPSGVLQCHHLTSMAHVHPHVTTVHAGPRARAGFQEILLYIVPLPVGKIKGFCAPLEPALHLYAVPANDMELTTVEKLFAFIALPCHVMKLAHSSFATSYTNAGLNSSHIKIIKIHNATSKIHFIICLLIPKNSK